MAKTRAQKNRAFRQDYLREMLASRGHLQHIDTILEELMGDKQIDALELQRKKVVIDTKLALIKKFLPDLKAIEITGAEGGDIKTSNKFTIEVIDAEASDTEEVAAATEAKEV